MIYEYLLHIKLQRVEIQNRFFLMNWIHTHGLLRCYLWNTIKLINNESIKSCLLTSKYWIFFRFSDSQRTMIQAQARQHKNSFVFTQSVKKRKFAQRRHAETIYSTDRKEQFTHGGCRRKWLYHSACLFALKCKK